MKKWKKPQVIVIDKDKLDKALKDMKSGCPGKPDCTKSNIIYIT